MMYQGSQAGYQSKYQRTCHSGRDSKPVPPIEAYEAYAATLDSRCRIDPIKYRRMTIMVRSGTGITDAARAVGYAACPRGYRKLPDHLK